MKSEDDDDDEPVVKFRTFWSSYLLLPPAMCDMIATCVMYIGLTLTSASSFQVWPQPNLTNMTSIELLSLRCFVAP